MGRLAGVVVMRFAILISGVSHGVHELEGSNPAKSNFFFWVFLILKSIPRTSQAPLEYPIFLLLLKCLGILKKSWVGNGWGWLGKVREVGRGQKLFR